MVSSRFSSRTWPLGILVTAVWATAAMQSAAAQENDQPVKFKQVVVQDTTLKQPAFTVLIPGDWQGEGRVFWRNHPIFPATSAFVAAKPGTAEQIRIYPQLPFIDGIRKAAADTAAIAGPDAVRFAVSNFPEGGNYMGNEVRIIMSPAKYVEEIILKRFRKEITTYKVLKTENMPAWAKSSAVAAEALPGMPVRTGAARVRIEYNLDGRKIHEDFFVLLASVEILQCQYWGAESSSSVRAEAGQLDKLQAIHQTVVHSVKIDEKWFSRYVQVAQILQDVVRQQQKQVMEISNIIRQTNDHVSKTISDGYWARQAVQDKMHLQFSNIIRGVDQYVLPGEKSTVTLPSGYSHVWVSNLGEYTLSNNANFNPNQNQQYKGTWTQVKSAR